jgi:hypothetical protein
MQALMIQQSSNLNGRQEGIMNIPRSRRELLPSYAFVLSPVRVGLQIGTAHSDEDRAKAGHTPGGSRKDLTMGNRYARATTPNRINP